MQIPRIPAAKPVAIPAIEERQYPELFLRSLTFTGEPGGPLRLACIGQPYDYDTDQLGPRDQTLRIEIDDLISVAMERAEQDKPALMQAFGAVIAAFGEMANEAPEGETLYEIKPGDKR